MTNEQMLGTLMRFINTYIQEYLKQPVIYHGKDETYHDEVKRKEEFEIHWDRCTSDQGSKEYVKLFIQQLITAEKRTKDVYLSEFTNEYKVHRGNIDTFLKEYENTYPTEYLWKVLFHQYYLEYGDNALNHFIEVNKFNRLRMDEFQEKQFYISTQDLVEIYTGNEPILSYEDKLYILVQICYENIKGAGIIDDLLTQNTDGWDLGVSGIPDAKVGSDLPRFYDSIAIRYKGDPFHLKFLSFHSEAEMEKVIEIIIQHNKPGEFSEKKGYLLGYRKNGENHMRFTAAKPPFGENIALWLRNFPIKNVTLEKLVRGMWGQEFKNWESIVNRSDILAKGCVNLTINGEQGLGKTTFLLGYLEKFYSWYPLRISERHFELWAKYRYPGRNIYTTQVTENHDETEGYNFSLRSSGLISVIGENREDETTDAIIKSGNRGNKCMVSAYHPNDPDVTLFEIANSLLRRGVYSSLKDAITAAGRTIRGCIQITRDADANRYYNIYEFQPNIVNLSDDFLNLKGQERTEAFMVTMFEWFQRTTIDQMYKTVPIVEYDLELEQYVVKNKISDSLYDHIRLNLQKKEDFLRAKKIYRPEEYIKDILLNNHQDFSIGNIERVILENNMDHYIDITAAARNLSTKWKEGIA